MPTDLTSDAPARTRVVLLTGDGKGKTSSALGMVLRAVGNGLQVAFVQFLKRRQDVGELTALQRFPEVHVDVCGRGFVPPPESPRRQAHAEAAVSGLALARRRLAAAEFGMVVLDEVCGAVALGLLDAADVLDAVRAARPGMIVILTGRDACPGLIDLADTVSRIECVKHALDHGWHGQRGVEL